MVSVEWTEMIMICIALLLTKISYSISQGHLLKSWLIIKYGSAGTSFKP